MAGRSAKLVTATLLCGAALGAVYDGVGLIDRWNAKGSLLQTEPTPEAVPATAIADPATQGAAPAPESSATTASPNETPEADPLRARMTTRLRAELDRLGCGAITLSALDLSRRFTPASETTSGFDSLYLEAQATLRDEAAVAIIDLAGSGKGPGHEARATDSAARGLAKALAGEDIANSCSKLEE